jgi:hypothetical protein
LLDLGLWPCPGIAFFLKLRPGLSYEASRMKASLSPIDEIASTSGELSNGSKLALRKADWFRQDWFLLGVGFYDSIILE